MKPCGCPICATNDALRVLREAADQIDAASNAWIEHGAEDESSLYFLHDEIAAVIAMPWWKHRAARKRLTEALTTAKTSAPWQDAVHRHDWGGLTRPRRAAGWTPPEGEKT